MAATKSHLIEAQHVLGSAKRDLFATIDWLFPGGLEHNALGTESGAFTKVVNAIARELGGLGKLPDADIKNLPRELISITPDVAIIGAGSAGAAAAKMLRQENIEVKVFDQLFWRKEQADYTATIIGFYDERFLLASDGNNLFQISPRSIIVANGANELPPDCIGSDLPGVFSRRAVEIAMSFGISPGQKIVVAISPQSDSYTVEKSKTLIESLVKHGVDISATVGFNTPISNIRNLEGPINSIDGSNTVERVRVGAGDAIFECDTLVWCATPIPSYNLPMQMGIDTSFLKTQRMFIPKRSDDGSTERPGIFLSGEVAGLNGGQAAADGARVGENVGKWLKNGGGISR